MIPLKIETASNKYYFYNNDIESIKKIVYRKLGNVKIKKWVKNPSGETFLGYEIFGTAVVEKHSKLSIEQQLTFFKLDK